MLVEKNDASSLPRQLWVLVAYWDSRRDVSVPETQGKRRMCYAFTTTTLDVC